jgi:hypothetical protein
MDPKIEPRETSFEPFLSDDKYLSTFFFQVCNFNSYIK